jgi:hypothetical protein
MIPNEHGLGRSASSARYEQRAVCPVNCRRDKRSIPLVLALASSDPRHEGNRLRRPLERTTAMGHTPTPCSVQRTRKLVAGSLLLCKDSFSPEPRSACHELAWTLPDDRYGLRPGGRSSDDKLMSALPRLRRQAHRSAGSSTVTGRLRSKAPNTLKSQCESYKLASSTLAKPSPMVVQSKPYAVLNDHGHVVVRAVAASTLGEMPTGMGLEKPDVFRCVRIRHARCDKIRSVCPPFTLLLIVARSTA